MIYPTTDSLHETLKCVVTIINAVWTLLLWSCIISSTCSAVMESISPKHRMSEEKARHHFINLILGLEYCEYLHYSSHSPSLQQPSLLLLQTSAVITILASIYCTIIPNFTCIHHYCLHLLLHCSACPQSHPQRHQTWKPSLRWWQHTQSNLYLPLLIWSLALALVLLFFFSPVHLIW